MCRRGRLLRSSAVPLLVNYHTTSIGHFYCSYLTVTCRFRRWCWWPFTIIVRSSRWWWWTAASGYVRGTSVDHNHAMISRFHHIVRSVHGHHGGARRRQQWFKRDVVACITWLLCVGCCCRCRLRLNTTRKISVIGIGSCFQW